METTMTEVQTEWKRLCALDEIPMLGSRVVTGTPHGDIAAFRTSDYDVFAIHDKCLHKGGMLSQGIVHGRSVTCPLHSWKVRLEDGTEIRSSRGFRDRVEDVLADAPGTARHALTNRRRRRARAAARKASSQAAIAPPPPSLTTSTMPTAHGHVALAAS